MLPDEHAVRHRLDARRLRRAAHDRQYVLSPALFCLARSLQHHAREADCASWSIAATAGGCWPCRRPSRWASATAAGSIAWASGRSLFGARLGRRSRRCSGASRSKAEVPFPRLRPSRPRRARIRQPRRVEIDAGQASNSCFAPDPDEPWGEHYPHAVLSPRDKHARKRSRRSAATSCSTSTESAAAGLRRDPDAADQAFAFAVVGSMTDPARGSAGGEICRRRRRATMLAAQSTRFWRAVTRGVRMTNAKGRSRGDRHDFALACP